MAPLTAYHQEPVWGQSAAFALPESRVVNFILVFAIFVFFLVPASLLLTINWHYLGGGGEMEKIHPATYLLAAASLWAFTTAPGFRLRALGVMLSSYSFVAFAVCVFAAATYAVLAQGASAAPFIDTFGSALIVTLVLTTIPTRSLMILRAAIDVFFIVGIGIIFAEYVVKHALIFQVNPLIYTTEGEFVYVFRPTGPFGSPMLAAELFGLYAIANLVSTPVRYSASSVARVLLSILAFLAVFATGGRAPLAIGVVVITAYIVVSTLRSLSRGYVNVFGVAIFAAFLCLVALIIPIVAQFGLFDLMLDRFSNDYGSALAREFAWQILAGTPLQDLWFGLPLQQVFAMQTSRGLIAIEVTWINFILVCGLVLTIPVFVTYFLFLFRFNARYCQFGIYFISLFQFLLSSASNGLWSKTTGFSIGLAIAFCFLRRDLHAPSPQTGTSQPYAASEPPGRAALVPTH